MKKPISHQSSGKQLNSLQQLEQMHPYKLILILSMLGSSLIFLFMLVAFAVSINSLAASTEYAYLPKAFFISTLLILGSHFFILPIKSQFYSGQLSKMHLHLGLVILLSLAFISTQLYAWYELKNAGLVFNGLPSDSFLYVITGLHAIHLVGAIVFALIVMRQLAQMRHDPVKYLIAETNPYWQVQLELLKLIWIFLDIVWLVFFLFFLFIF